MPQNLYITATEERSGKSVIVLGVMQMLVKEVHKVAFFRPIISDTEPGDEDPDISLVLDHFDDPSDFFCELRNVFCCYAVVADRLGSDSSSADLKAVHEASGRSGEGLGPILRINHDVSRRTKGPNRHRLPRFFVSSV